VWPPCPLRSSEANSYFEGVFRKIAKNAGSFNYFFWALDIPTKKTFLRRRIRPFSMSLRLLPQLLLNNGMRNAVYFVLMPLIGITLKSAESTAFWPYLSKWEEIRKANSTQRNILLTQHNWFPLVFSTNQMRVRLRIVYSKVYVTTIFHFQMFYWFYFCS